MVVIIVSPYQTEDYGDQEPYQAEDEHTERRDLGDLGELPARGFPGDVDYPYASFH
jgi:hypothetical protein